MRSKVSYEWTLETMEGEDVAELDFADSLSEYSTVNPSQRHVLVRDWGNENQGLQDRQWAYVEGWRLPDEFDGGAKVPQRFQSELAANMQRLICS